MRRLLALLCLAVLIGVAPIARAADLDISGLSTDSGKYADSLTAKFPAGGNPVQRRAAEQKAADAERKRDWAGAVAAWEVRIGLGDAGAGAWMSLAQDAMRETPPDPRHAMMAAYQAFELASDPKAEIAPLLMIADALKMLDRPAQAITALEAAQDRAPDDAQIKQALLTARRAAGILVRNLRNESEADPPRACISFTTAPLRSDDFHPQDWVKLDPAVSGAAVTREGDEICVSGLPSGQQTGIILRAGMPGEDGLTLVKETRLTADIGNRRPARRLRPAHVHPAARPGAGGDDDHGEPVGGEADAGADDRAQHRRVPARQHPRPADRHLPGLARRHRLRPRRLAGQRAHSVVQAEPQHHHRAAAAARRWRMPAPASMRLSPKRATARPGVSIRKARRRCWCAPTSRRPSGAARTG